MKIIDPNTPEGEAELRYRRKRAVQLSMVGPVIFLIAAILVGGAIDLFAYQWWYGDWKCAFVNCVRVQDIKNP